MKAYWHQTGQGNLPKRPFFGFNKKVERVIQKNFEKYIKKEIKRLQI
jgi:phage gpG-like protein